jgi:hypothetical protein
MQAKGTFEISMQAEPPFHEADGVSLGRMTFEKVFSGPLAGASTVYMMGVHTPVAGSAGYVAVERFTGTLAGKHGAFVMQHLGSMKGGAFELTVKVVPDSASGELKGLAGRLAIDIVDGQHFYTFDYDFACDANGSSGARQTF